MLRQIVFPKPRCATQQERKGRGEDEMSQRGRGAERDSARRIYQGTPLATTDTYPAEWRNV